MIKKYIFFSLLIFHVYGSINARSTMVSNDQVQKMQQQDIRRIDKKNNALKASNKAYRNAIDNRSSKTTEQALNQFKQTGDASYLDLSFNQDLGDLIQSIKKTNPNITFTFKGAKLLYANLSTSDGSMNDLSGVDFSLSTAEGINLISCNLQGADFTSAQMKKSYLIGADISKANFQNTQLPGAIISYATAQGTNFTYANLTGVDVTSSNFSKAIFKGAIVTGVNLSLANTSDVNWNDTKIDASNHLNFTGGVSA